MTRLIKYVSLIIVLELVFSLCIITPVQATATITLSPAIGKVGDIITITGTGWEGNANISVIYQIQGATTSGTSAAVSAGQFSLNFQIPPSVQGAHLITVSGSDNGVQQVQSFNVIPSIVLGRTSGEPGTIVTVNGNGFGNAETGIILKFSDANITIVGTTPTVSSLGAWSSTFSVPALIAGAYTVTAIGALNIAATAPFSVTPPGSGGGGGGGGGPTPQYGGVLSIVTPYEPQMLAYPPYMGIPDTEAVLPIVERLLDVAKDRSSGDGLEPVLASSYDFDLVNKTLTFHIRPGVHFSDGSALNADAVIWNFQVLLDSGHLAYEDYWNSICKIDNTTVQISFSQYNNQLVQAWGCTAIFSKAAFDQYCNGDLNTYINWSKTHVVGTGPFVLQEFQQDVQMTLVKNPNYWRTGRPYLDGINFYYVTDPTTAQIALEAGQVDELWYVPTQNQLDLVRKGYIRRSGWASSPFYLWPNSSGAGSPWSDIRVRYALEYALDKTAIAQSMGYGFYVPMTMLAPPGEWGYDLNYYSRNYDRAKARQLLADAGYLNGFKTHLLIGNSSASLAVGTAIKSYLAELGIEITLDVADSARFLDAMYKSNPYSDLCLTQPRLDVNFLSTYLKWFSTDREWPVSYMGHTPYQESLDQAAKHAVTAPDQKAATAQAVNYITDNALVIPLYSPTSATIDRATVQNDRYSQGLLRWQSENSWISTTDVANDVPITLSPSTVGPIGSGATFNLEIKTNVSASQPVDGVDAYIKFDPAVLEVVDADTTEAGVQIAPGASLSSILANSADNSAGLISYSAGQLNSPFPSGVFTVAAIQFRAKTVNSQIATAVTISLSGENTTSVVDYGGNPLPGVHSNSLVEIVPSSSFSLNVVLQGDSRPESGWVVPLTIKFFSAGNGLPVDVLTATPSHSFNLTSSGSWGQATAQIAVPPGVYDVSLVTPHSLVNVKRGVLIDAATNLLDMGTLLEGNANGDTKISILDFGVLAAAYGKSSGQSSYDARADFDRSGSITINDFGLLAGNYGKTSPQTVPTSTNDDQYGGIFRLADTRAPSTTLGWFAEAGAQGGLWSPPMLETLMECDINGAFSPMLATGWSVSADLKTITFNLRQGVKFHDGSDFNATVAKWNLEQMIQSQGDVNWTNVSSVDLIDAYTIRLNLSEYQNTLLNTISATFMTSKVAFDKNGKEWLRWNPVGTGPFRFVSFQRDVSIKYTRFNDYWQTGKPYLDGIEMYFVADPITMSVAFEACYFDAIGDDMGSVHYDLQQKGYPIVKGNSGAFTLVPDSQNNDSPWADIRVRMALEYAINRDALIQARGFGFWQEITQFANPGTPYYVSNLNYRNYNPAKAKQLLADAGFPNGFKTRIYADAASTDLDAITAIQAYLKAVGIQAELQWLDSASYSNYRSQGWINGLLAGATGFDANLNSSYGRYWVQSAAYYPSMKKPAELQNLYLASLASREVDPVRVQEMVRFCYNNALMLPLWAYSRGNVIKSYVKDTGFYTMATWRDWKPYQTWLDR